MYALSLASKYRINFPFVCVIPQLDANSPSQRKRQFSPSLLGGNQTGRHTQCHRSNVNSKQEQVRDVPSRTSKRDMNQARENRTKQLRDNTEIWAIQNNPDVPDLQPHVCMRTSTAASKTSSKSSSELESNLHWRPNAATSCATHTRAQKCRCRRSHGSGRNTRASILDGCTLGVSASRTQRTCCAWCARC